MVTLAKFQTFSLNSLIGLGLGYNFIRNIDRVIGYVQICANADIATSNLKKMTKPRLKTAQNTMAGGKIENLPRY